MVIPAVGTGDGLVEVAADAGGLSPLPLAVATAPLPLPLPLPPLALVEFVIAPAAAATVPVTGMFELTFGAGAVEAVEAGSAFDVKTGEELLEVVLVLPAAPTAPAPPTADGVVAPLALPAAAAALGVFGTEFESLYRRMQYA